MTHPETETSQTQPRRQDATDAGTGLARATSEPAPHASDIRVVSIGDEPGPDGRVEMVLEMSDAAKAALEEMAQERGLTLDGLISAILDAGIEAEITAALDSVAAWMGDRQDWPAASGAACLAVSATKDPALQRVAARVADRLGCPFDTGLLVTPDGAEAPPQGGDVDPVMRALSAWILAGRCALFGTASATGGVWLMAVLLHIAQRPFVAAPETVAVTLAAIADTEITDAKARHAKGADTGAMGLATLAQQIAPLVAPAPATPDRPGAS